MRSAYALIPAALLAGTVLSASPETQAKRLDDPGAHTQWWNARQEYFKSRAKIRPAKGPLKVAKAQSDESWSRAREADPALKMASIAWMSMTKPLRSGPRETAKPVAPVPAIAPIAPAEEAIVVPREADPALKMASIGWMSMTKPLRSGPRETAKPVAPVPIGFSQFRIKPNETSGTAHVGDIIRELAPSYGVPTWFALRIAMVESGYDPYALGLAGEIGVYQLKCETARLMGFTGECFRLTDARTNVRWGLKHLSLAIASSGGDLQLAASKHNGGLGCKSLVDSYVAKVWLSCRRCDPSQIPGEACTMSLSDEGAVFGQAHHP
jgi:soluble lytic murein transglycosylase-like protein